MAGRAAGAGRTSVEKYEERRSKVPQWHTSALNMPLGALPLSQLLVKPPYDAPRPTTRSASSQAACSFSTCSTEAIVSSPPTFQPTASGPEAEIARQKACPKPVEPRKLTPSTANPAEAYD